MSVELNPYVRADVVPIPLDCGFLISPPLLLWGAAHRVNAESSASHNGRYHKHSREIESAGAPKFQPTTLFSSLNTGRVFDLVSGTVKDDWVAPWSNQNALLFPTSASGATFEVIDHTAGSKLTHQLIVVRRGIPPPASGPTESTTYLYIELCHGDPIANYRIAMEYGNPIRLDYENVATTAGFWQPVAVASDLGSLETYLGNHNGEIRFRVKPDAGRGTMVVEVGDGYFLRRAEDRPKSGSDPLGNPADYNAVGALPTTERYRITGKNGWASVEVYPMRYKALNVQGTKRPTGRPLPQIGSAGVVHNGTGRTDPNQASVPTLTQDGDNNLSWSVDSSLPDAGDSLGSDTPPRFRDIMVLIPGEWARVSMGTPIPDVAPPIIQVHEQQVWDDANRIGRTFGRLMIDNSDGRYNGAFGNYALNLVMGNGYTFGQRLRGTMGTGPEGMKLRYNDPWRTVSVPFSDNFVKMEVPLGYEVVLDGVSLYTAFRLLAEAGNIDPTAFMGFIPNPGLPDYPPGAKVYPLPKGTGTTPAMKFLPNRTVLSCLLDLITNAGDVNDFTGSSTPFYTFFDPFGLLHFEPYNPGYYPVSKVYSTYDPSGSGQIIGPLEVYNSTAGMRTNVTVQGQDGLTYEALWDYRELPQNYGTVGYRYGAIERDAQYASEPYVKLMNRILAIQASLGTQIVPFMAPFDPYVFAGQVVALPELGGYYTILGIESFLGAAQPESNSGFNQCFSMLTCRSLRNALVF